MMWCPLPWTHVSIKNNGALRVCSHSQSAGTGNTLLFRGRKALTIDDLSPQTLNCDTLKEIRKEFMDGNWPSQCTRCKIEFESKGSSRNIWETDTSTFSREELLSKTKPDGSLIDPVITNYDLRIGNHCNLRCAMCFPGESSKWYDIYEELYGHETFKVDGQSYKLSDGVDQFNWIRQRGNVDKVVDNAPQLTKLSLSGGEPMAIKHHMDILRGIIDSGSSKNVEIEYQTNLTLIPDTLINLWKKFKKIHVGVSIDGIGQANEAYRYPSKWDVLEKNLWLLDKTDENIEVYTSSTIHILSLEYHNQLMQWLKDQQFNKVNKATSHPNYNTHHVYYPKFLTVGILDSHLFDMYDPSTFTKAFYQRTTIDNDKAVEYRKEFVTKFEKFEQIQNQDWQQIFPLGYKVKSYWKEKYNL